MRPHISQLVDCYFGRKTKGIVVQVRNIRRLRSDELRQASIERYVVQTVPPMKGSRMRTPLATFFACFTARTAFEMHDGVQVASAASASSNAGVANVHLHAQARRSGHVNQGVEAEQVDLAAGEVRDPRLGHAKDFGRLRLA